jgi:predicted ATP-grasp superfamily ATP-dependent carboligase
MDHRTATLRFQHLRLHEWPPEGGVSTLCRVEPARLHRAQMAKSEDLLAAIGWQGPAMVEYRFDPLTGRYALMEINGRFWGSMPLATHAGAHFAWEAYRRAVLGDVTPAPPHREGLRARYMIPETRRLLRLLFKRGEIADPFFKARPLCDLVSYLLGFFDPRMRYYLFSLRDPGPFLADAKSVLLKALRLGRP